MRWLLLISRRLLGIVPTLVGVTLLSFAILALAPAPTGRTESERAERARSNFVDLPSFYNRAPRDLELDVDDALYGVGTEQEHEAWIERVSARGAVLVPVLVPRLGALAPDARSVALRLLRPSLLEFMPDASPTSPDEEATLWIEIYEARRLDFRNAHIRRLLRRYMRDNDEEAQRELHTLGTFALQDIVIELDLAPPRALPGLVALLDGILPHAFAASAQGDVNVRAHAWKEWWFSHRVEYVSWTSIEAMTARVRETRYGRWAERLVTLELGLSSYDGSPIAPRLWAGSIFTLGTVLCAILLAWLAAVPVGLFAAIRHRRAGDRIVGSLSFLIYAVPSVWVATLLAPWVVAAPGDSNAMAALVCIAALSYPTFVFLSRQQRSSALAVLRSDFVRTARAKGGSELHILVHHVLRLALVPVATLAGLQLPLLLGTSIVLEGILQLPGLGRETLLAVTHRDVSWLVVVTAFAAAVSVLGVLAGDLLSLVDPRVRRRAVSVVS